MQAYSPLGGNGSAVIKDEVVMKVAEERGVSGAEVCLAWLGESHWRGTAPMERLWPRTISGSLFCGR